MANSIKDRGPKKRGNRHGITMEPPWSFQGQAQDDPLALAMSKTI